MARQETEAPQASHDIPLWRCCVWYVTWAIFKPLLGVIYRFHVRRRYLPARGPGLVLANHQSFLDPILIGLASPGRPIWSVARKSLWGNKRWVDFALDTYNAFPINIEEMDMPAIRRCIDIMKDGHTLVMFPEGTRTADGSVAPFAPGLMLLIKRAKPTVVPVAIDGAFGAWSRHMKKPRLFANVKLSVGDPIPAEELLAMPADAAIERVRACVVDMMGQGQRPVNDEPSE